MNTRNAARVGIAAAIALALTTIIAGCGTGEASVTVDNATETPSRIPVEATSPIRRDIYATYTASASIASDADAPVTARVAGEIVALLVEEGDQVEAGQVLAQLDGERLRLEMLVAAANLKKARREYGRNIDLHDRGLISSSLFEGLKFDLDALEATFDLRKLNYSYSYIRATIAGVVSSRDVKSGETLTAGQVAFRITETTELIAYLQIPQAELAKFAQKHAASITVAAFPDTRFPAQIVRISPTIDKRNGTFRATAIIENPNGELAPGMFGKFTIAYDKHENALVIPARAALDEDEKKSVYVVNNGEVLRRIITTGIEQDGHLEVLGGLRDDEKIVVVGHTGLRDGSKVLAQDIDRDSFTG